MSNKFELLSRDAAEEAKPAVRPAGPVGAAKPHRDVKLSKNIMGLKFMQRSVQKNDVKAQEAEAAVQVKQVRQLYMFCSGAVGARAALCSRLCVCSDQALFTVNLGGYEAQLSSSAR